MKKESVRKLERVQLGFLKRLLQLPRSAPTAGVWWDSGCLPMEWRIVAEKLKFVQHLEWKVGESLAAKLWRLEKEEKVTGLKAELEMYINKYSLPPPSRLMSKAQYKKALKKAVQEEARGEIRIMLTESSKLRYLVGWEQDRGPQMTMTDLERIRFITRCRLGSHSSFTGDFGSGKHCSCGNLDTIGHVRRGCHLYNDILPESYETYNSVELSEAVYKAILARKEELERDRREQLSGCG